MIRKEDQSMNHTLLECLTLSCLGYSTLNFLGIRNSANSKTYEQGPSNMMTSAMAKLQVARLLKRFSGNCFICKNKLEDYLIFLT